MNQMCPLKFLSGSPNPQGLRMCLYLEIGPLERYVELNDVARVGPDLTSQVNSYGA